MADRSRILDAQVRRIAVLRANSIGDLVLAMPALEALRNRFPEARIVLLGGPIQEALLGARPGPVDRIERVPVWPGVWCPNGAVPDDDATEAFFARMADERFDLAVQLHGGGANSNPFTLRLGARFTIGLRAEDAPALDRWVRYVSFQPEVLRHLEVVRLVGAVPVTLEPRLTVTELDRREARAALGGPDAGTGAFVVLNAGANDARRRWRPERFSAIGDALAQAGHAIVVSGAAEDRPLAQQVVDGMRHPARSVAGELSLTALVGVLSAAALVVSNDSGPLHLAAAVGTATVGIYWCTNALNWTQPMAHRHRKAIGWRLDCPVCGAHCVQHDCGHRESFLDDIGVDEVLASARDLLSLDPRARVGQRASGGAP